ncbi:MAG: hypothetical protein FWD19_00350 [Defluviitaleaceae bacterium]|nr:hypothetical protein [Defluviitaleaceae bacterium]
MDENKNIDKSISPAEDKKPLIALILGIASIVLCCCNSFMSIGFAVGAIIISRHCPDDPRTNKYKKAGFVTGIVGLVLSIPSCIVGNLLFIIIAFVVEIIDALRYL